jgi:glycosyltransferase involved in cell wall biosynthesis
MRAGLASGNKVLALGILQPRLFGESTKLHEELDIRLAVRPKALQRRSLKAEIHAPLSQLEVSRGRTGPLRHLALIIWFTGKAIGLARKAKPDIVHAHDTIALPIAVALRIFFRATVIYDAHELESDKAGGSRLQNRLILAIEKACWPWVGGFITVSQAIGEWYRRKFGAPGAVIVLNTPEVAAPLVMPEDFREESDIRVLMAASEGDLVFTYVGAFEPGRGLEELIAVFSKPEVLSKLAILGDGTIREQLRTLAFEHDNIVVLDPVPHHHLVKFIGGADYGFSMIQNISLSDYLCLPNKMFEYLNAGLTVICSDFPEMARVVNENAFGYAVEESVESIFDLVQTLSREPRPQKIELARIEEFTWRAQALKLQALYVSLS